MTRTVFDGRVDGGERQQDGRAVAGGEEVVPHAADGAVTRGQVGVVERPAAARRRLPPRCSTRSPWQRRPTNTLLKHSRRLVQIVSNFIGSITLIQQK